MITIDLSGKRALITGATGELGAVMARTLAQAGAGVVFHYMNNRAKADTLVEEITAMGVDAAAVQGDVTMQDGIAAIKAGVMATGALPDIVVANAVIQYDWKPVLEQPEADYDSQFRSCVLQNVFLSKAFIPAMQERKSGRYIGINTECTMQCHPSQSAYIAGKAGMDRVLRVLAREVGGDGITVNQVAPGWTVSENRPESDDTKSYREQVPLKRRGVAQEIANAVLFLASDLASFISGCYLPVCGGNVMPRI